MKRTENQLDSKQILAVIERYSDTLELLDAYDHQTLKRPKGNEATYVLTYEECVEVMKQMRFGDELYRIIEIDTNSIVAFIFKVYNIKYKGSPKEKF